MSGVSDARPQLEAIFREALGAVDGAEVVARALDRTRSGFAVAGRPVRDQAGVVLLAVGKAAIPMAAAFEERCGRGIRAGLVVTQQGQRGPRTKARLLEAAHPVPDASCPRAAGAVFALLEATGAEDVVCVLLSGGTSSLLAHPVEGLTLRDLSITTELLLESGADIAETNTVRKRLAAAAGGRLAQRSRAQRIEVLAVSDVPGDRVDLIGSGPFCPDRSGFAEAREVLRARGLGARVPGAVRSYLEAGARGERDPGPRPGDPCFAGVRTTLLATNRDAVAAAREAGLRRGLDVRVVSAPLAGEARDAGQWLAGLARRVAPERPTLLVAGGETAVTVRGGGRGGRSQELALAAALEFAGEDAVALLAAGTDGVDGPTHAAGAFVDSGTVARGRAAGVDARRALAENDSHGFFTAEGGLLVTGPTATNVMDLALVRVDPLRG